MEIQNHLLDCDKYYHLFNFREEHSQFFMINIQLEGSMQ